MIYVNLNSGGIGNQLFQLNIFHTLKSKYGDKVKPFYHRNWGYDFDYKLGLMNLFNIDVDMASLTEIRKLYHFPIDIVRGKNVVSSIINKLHRFYIGYINKSKSIKYGYNPLIMQASLSSYIDLDDYIMPNRDYVLYGLWTHENYIISNIRNFSSFLMASAKFDCKFIPENSSKVIIHIRGGNFLMSSNHNICDESYYASALYRLKLEYSHINKIEIITDDSDFVNTMDFYKILPYEILSSDYINDFKALLEADFAIIPNSSFSMWARLISPYNKLTVLPKYFYKSNKEYWSLNFKSEKYLTMDNLFKKTSE